MRIGQGYDIHQLGENRDLIIGGVKIEHTLGCIAHSDGDVLIHAIIDAILGSQALGDIGTYFPPSDDKYKNIDSAQLLKETLKIAKCKIINIDSSIILQEPRLGPYIQSIRANLAALLNIEITQISVKAKTAEKMGPVGQKKAIEALVNILTE